MYYSLISSMTKAVVISDAQAFINATGITDATQKSAINTLVDDLKSYGIWSKMKAIYPMVGGAATTHKFNLKDPRDLDAAFRLVFNGGWTHSGTGALPNGTTAYADTKLIPSVSLTLNNASLSYYSRTNGYVLGVEIGARVWNMSDVSLGIYGSSVLTGRVNTYSNSANISISDTLGLYQITRTGGSTQKVFKNGASNSASITTSTIAVNYPIYLSVLNVGGTATYFSNRQCSFASIGDGLTDTEAANLYTAVQNFNTTLARQV